jgi:hypothetical protein
MDEVNARMGCQLFGAVEPLEMASAARAEAHPHATTLAPRGREVECLAPPLTNLKRRGGHRLQCAE